MPTHTMATGELELGVAELAAELSGAWAEAMMVVSGFRRGGFDVVASSIVLSVRGLS